MLRATVVALALTTSLTPAALACDMDAEFGSHLAYAQYQYEQAQSDGRNDQPSPEQTMANLRQDFLSRFKVAVDEPGTEPGASGEPQIR